MCGDGHPKRMSGPRSPCRACLPPWDSMWAVGLATPWPFASCQPSLTWSQHPRVTSPSPDAIEESQISSSHGARKSQKERHAETSPQAQSDRFRNGGLWQDPLNKSDLTHLTCPWTIALSGCSDPERIQEAL